MKNCKPDCKKQCLRVGSLGEVGGVARQGRQSLMLMHQASPRPAASFWRTHIQTDAPQ